MIVQASLFGRAGIFIRGHADPSLVWRTFVQAGMKKGNLTREGTLPRFKYFWDQQTLDVTDTKRLIELIRTTDFAGTSTDDPKVPLQSCQTLSEERAAAVRQAVLDYAKSQGLRLAANQIRALGMGIEEPLIPKPQNLEEAAKDRRVEFRISKVSAEASSSTDFQY